jgi:hypothetical protein
LSETFENFFARAVARIDDAEAHGLAKKLFMPSVTLALNHNAIWLKPERAEIRELFFLRSRHNARSIDVLKPHHPVPPELAGELVGDPRSSKIP